MTVTQIPRVPAGNSSGTRGMGRRTIKALWRAGHLLAVLLVVTFAGTALAILMPGSPGATILGPAATAEQIAAFNTAHGYDQPVVLQYLHWVGNALTGDLGTSVVGNQPVLQTILQRFPVTLEISVLALVISLAVAIPAALYAGAHAGGRLDRVASALTSGLMSVPVFVLGVLLIYILAVATGLFPVAGWSPLSAGVTENLKFAFLPSLALAMGEFPTFYRLLRSDVIGTLGEDFVQTARVRGLPGRYIMLRHVLRPSAIPLVTVAAVAFGRLLAGSIIVESLFSLPGIGSLALQSIPAKDLPVIQGVVVFIAVSYVLINAAVDVIYSVLDPRVRGS